MDRLQRRAHRRRFRCGAGIVLEPGKKIVFDGSSQSIQSLFIRFACSNKDSTECDHVYKSLVSTTGFSSDAGGGSGSGGTGIGSGSGSGEGGSGGTGIGSGSSSGTYGSGFDSGGSGIGSGSGSGSASGTGIGSGSGSGEGGSGGTGIGSGSSGSGSGHESGLGGSGSGSTENVCGDGYTWSTTATPDFNGYATGVCVNNTDTNSYLLTHSGEEKCTIAHGDYLCCFIRGYGAEIRTECSVQNESQCHESMWCGTSTGTSTSQLDCASQTMEVGVIDDNGNKYYLLDGHQNAMRIGLSTYRFTNIPDGHPLGLRSLEGSDCNTELDAIGYQTGNATWTIPNSCVNQTISLYCQSHGYMGGQDRFTVEECTDRTPAVILRQMTPANCHRHRFHPLNQPTNLWSAPTEVHYRLTAATSAATTLRTSASPTEQPKLNLMRLKGAAALNR